MVRVGDRHDGRATTDGEDVVAGRLRRRSREQLPRRLVEGRRLSLLLQIGQGRLGGVELLLQAVGPRLRRVGVDTDLSRQLLRCQLVGEE